MSYASRVDTGCPALFRDHIAAERTRRPLTPPDEVVSGSPATARFARPVPRRTIRSAIGTGPHAVTPDRNTDIPVPTATPQHSKSPAWFQGAKGSVLHARAPP